MAQSSNFNTTPQDTEDDEVINLPQVDNSHLIARYKKSLVGRVLNADSRSIEAILTIMPRPKIWDVEGRVRGIDLGNGRFQFDFNSEADLLKVLNKRPCHFNNWSFPLERWEPHVGDVFPNTMTFWISVKGIPNHFWLTEIFNEIGGKLGIVRAIDASTARVQVTVAVDAPLKFSRKAKLPTGEIVQLEMRYERLHRWCFHCGYISHEERTCPRLTADQRKERMAVREAARELSLETHEDRSRGRDLQQRSYHGPSPIPSRLRRNFVPLETHPESVYRPQGSSGDHSRSKLHEIRDAERVNPPVNDGSNRENVWMRLDRGEHEKNDKRPTFREDLTYPNGNSSRFMEAPYRKRRYEESFASSKWRANHRKDKLPGPPVDRRRFLEPTRDRSTVGIKPQTSDSEQTISDLPGALQAAKQFHSSPEHQRSRPFRLSLQKRSDPMDRGKAIDMGDSMDSGSSARKSLTFDVPIPAVAEILASKLNKSVILEHESGSIPKKSWYEITMEEEEKEKGPSDVAMGMSSSSPPLDEDLVRDPTLLVVHVEEEKNNDLIMVEADLANDDWIDNDDLLGEDCDFNDEEFNQIDAELMLDDPPDLANTIGPLTSPTVAQTNLGGAHSLGVAKVGAVIETKEKTSSKSRSIPSWWRSDEATEAKADIPTKKKMTGSPRLPGLASKKKHMLRGRASPNFKVKGPLAKQGPTKKMVKGKAATSKKKGLVSGSHSSGAQNQMLTDSIR